MPKKNAGSAKTKRTTKAKPKKQKPKGKSGNIKKRDTAPAVEQFAKLFKYKLPKDWNKVGKKGGRPKSITENTLRKLEIAFAYDCTVEEACVFAGIPPSTYYDFLNMQPKFSETIEQLRNIPVLVARRTVVTSIGLNHSSAMDYLKRKRSEEFPDKIAVDNKGEVKHTHELAPKTQTAISNIFGNFERKAQDLEPKEDVVE